MASLAITTPGSNATVIGTPFTCSGTLTFPAGTTVPTADQLKIECLYNLTPGTPSTGILFVVPTANITQGISANAFNWSASFTVPTGPGASLTVTAFQQQDGSTTLFTELDSQTSTGLNVVTFTINSPVASTSVASTFTAQGTLAAGLQPTCYLLDSSNVLVAVGIISTNGTSWSSEFIAITSTSTLSVNAKLYDTTSSTLIGTATPVAGVTIQGGLRKPKPRKKK